MTAFLIEHEIEVQQESLTQIADMIYVESEIKDTSPHKSNIEKIFYFAPVDKVVLYEMGMNLVRVYDAGTMQIEKSITCVGEILALEYIEEFHAMAVSLSDRTIIFFDIQNKNNKIVRKLHVPSTQKCLTYIAKKQVLFSAGVDGAIFAWNMNKLF